MNVQTLLFAAVGTTFLIVFAGGLLIESALRSAVECVHARRFWRK